MSLVRNLMEKRYDLATASRQFEEGIFGRPSATGVSVTHNSAMTFSAWFDGVRIIAETVGKLPLIEYRRLQPRGKERATNRKLYHLLHDEPNPEMNAISFKESMQGQAVNWGNAFAEIEWDLDVGMPVALWPLRSDSMKVGRDEKTKELIYLYTLPDGSPVRLPSFRVWHMPGFGYDGLIGYDTVFLARESIGMALAVQEYGARFFGNGANPGGVITHPNKLTNEARENLRRIWNEMHQGLKNQHRIAVLEQGMEYHQVGIAPDNAQFMETSKGGVTEVARWLHIQPHKLGDLERATFSNIEEQNIDFVVDSMLPWFVRWEQTCMRKLLLPSEKPFFLIEFLIDAQLRGASDKRAAFYKELFYLGSLSPNDIREKENMNPIVDPGGDDYYIQANMLPMKLAGQQGQQSAGAQLDEALKKVAGREKQNILRAAGKYDQDSFSKWLADYYRDLPEYIERQVEPFTADPESLARDYIGHSLKALKEITPATAPHLLENWERKRSASGIWR